jgi:hypothetical protein
MVEILSFRFDEVFELIAFASTSGELTDTSATKLLLPCQPCRQTQSLQPC